MLQFGNQIRLTDKQKRVIEILLGEKPNPQTREEARAWFERAAKVADDGSREGALLRTALEDMAQDMAGPPKTG